MPHAICWGMPHLKTTEEPRKLRLEYVLRVCVACGAKLIYSHQSSGRTVVCLNEAVSVVSQVVSCENPRCPLHGELLHPPEEYKLAASGAHTGNDAWAKIARLRLVENKTYDKISELLEAEDGFVISARQTENLADLFGALVSGAHLQDGKLIGELKKSGKMVLSLDAAKPLKDDDAVWFIRDVLTGHTLAAATLRSSTTEDLRALLRPVKMFAKKHGIPIVGVISDAEKNIRRAVKKELCGVPHQLCQLHFVKNIAKPLASEDSALRKELRQRVRGLRQLERDVEAAVSSRELSEKQAEVLQNLSATIQSVLRDSGKPPFRPAGLMLYARLAELRAVLQEMQGTSSSGFVSTLLGFLEVLDELHAAQDWLLLYYQDVLKLGTIFFAKGRTAAEATRLFGELTAFWKGELKELAERDEDYEAQALLTGWIKLADSYGKDLFHHYSDPNIPATNNAMEKFIGDLKKLEQFLANNPRPASRFVRHAPTRALFFGCKHVPGEELLAACRREDIKRARAYLETRRKRASIAYRARRDFTGTLNTLREQWKAAAAIEAAARNQSTSTKAAA